jgi:citrate lyase synthetase
MEIIVYCNVDTSTHTNHISKKEEIASRYVNKELLGRVGLTLN